ncbi:MAG: ribonuclease Z [Nitrososphaerales archaeon]
MSDIKIQFLGTSSAVPTRQRGLSCTVLHFENELIIFDCGEGAQRAALAAGIGLNRESSVFITHMHGDHVVGLLGLMQTMSMNRREKPLRIFGPKSITEFIVSNQRILGFGLTYDAYAKTVRQGLAFESKYFRVFAQKSEHSRLSYAYVFEEKQRPGRFDTKKALALRVPEGPLWGRLQHGRNVKSERGRTIRPEQVLGKPRMGKRIGISGDTRPSDSLSRFFQGCDVIVADSTYGDQHKELALENMHSTSREAAAMAKRARAKTLILTHFSARYRNVTQLVKQAREVFPNTIAASDMMTYDLSAAE